MKVEIDRKNRIFDDFFKIDEAWIRYEQFDGKMSQLVRRLSFERGDAVAAVLYNRDTKKVILVSQFRFPSFTKGHGWLTEIIAGVLKRNEKPEEAIKREIIEEVGYKVTEPEYITTFFMSPGGTSERIVLFYCEVNNDNKISKGGGLKSEGEDIQIVEYNLKTIKTMLEKSEIIDAKTIIALQWLLRRKRQ